MDIIKCDPAAKSYFMIPLHFADLFNVALFKANIIDHHFLSSYNSDESLSIFNDEFFFSYNRRRDLIMHYDDGHIRCLLALEIQSSNHYHMPARINNYDDLTLMGQLVRYNKQHDKYQSFDALPLITLVLYLGEDDWNAPTSILHMYKGYIPETIRPYCHDYAINLFMTKDFVYDESISQDQENCACFWLIKKIYESDEPWKDIIDEFVLTKTGALFVASTIKDEELLHIIKETRGEKINMCRSIEREKERLKARSIEIGKSIGIEEGKSIGLEEGMHHLLLLQLESQFGHIDDNLSLLLRSSAHDQLILLAQNLFKIKNIEEVKNLLQH